MYENEEFDEIDIREIFQIIKNNLLPIIVTPIVFAIVGAIVSFFLIAPVYEASTTIIVIQNGTNQQLNKSDVDFSKSIIYTYAELAKSATVIENTRKSLNIEKLDPTLIKVSPVKDTQILKVAVQNTDAQLAQNTANQLVEEFTKEITRITKTDNVSVVDYAILPKNPIKPNKLMNTAISTVLGAMLAIFAVFLKEYLDNTVKSEKDIEKLTGISIIGLVPEFSEEVSDAYGKVRSKRKSRFANIRSV